MPSLLQPPGAPWTFNALLFLAAGAALLILAATQGGTLPLVSGLWCLLLGVALWKRLPWTRLAAVVSGLAATGVSIYLWATLGFTWPRALSVVFGPWMAWKFWRTLAPANGSDRPMVSLVLLLKQPRYLEAPVLAEILKSAWGLPFKAAAVNDSGNEDDALPFVGGSSPLFMVGTADGMFIIHNHDRPYFDDQEQLVEKVPDLRLRKVITDHTAWLSVDYMIGAEHDSGPAQYPRIAKAIAELADDTVAGLFQPEDSRLIPWDADLESRLRKGENLDDLFSSPHVPVVRISEDDPRMKAAVEEAKRRWPEFVAAFKARQSGGNYAVKAAITRGENTEFIWLEVIGLEPEHIHGKLANDPVDLGGLKLGDQVEAPLSDLNDWVYSHKEGEEPIGLFTVKVVADAWKQQTDEANKTE